MKSLMVRGLVSVVIGGLVLCGARVALAGPCEDRAELHYAIAVQLQWDAVESAKAYCERDPADCDAVMPDGRTGLETLQAFYLESAPDPDAAWEDANVRCGVEHDAYLAASELLGREAFQACENSGLTQVPGGWVATCWDAEGNELFSVEPDASELGQ